MSDCGDSHSYTDHTRPTPTHTRTHTHLIAIAVKVDPCAVAAVALAEERPGEDLGRVTHALTALPDPLVPTLVVAIVEVLVVGTAPEQRLHAGLSTQQPCLRVGVALAGMQKTPHQLGTFTLHNKNINIIIITIITIIIITIITIITIIIIIITTIVIIIINHVCYCASCKRLRSSLQLLLGFLGFLVLT
jgi:hypothetical protein